jgi:cell division protein FtsN
MISKKIVLSMCCALALVMSGCSRQQSDWQKARESNTVDGYEQFLKKYPSGEFTAQAQARVKEMYEERDWQKARDADTPEAYQAFLKQYPEGKWTEEARIRVENFTLAQAPAGSAPSPGGADSSGSSTPSAATADPGSTAMAPAPSAPSPPPAPPAPPSPPSHVAAAPHAQGSYGIQLGAFQSGADAAHQRWADLQKEYPSLLAGLSPKVSKANSGTLYRLRVAGLTEKHARDICSSLKAKSEACVVVPPGQG